MSAPHTMRFNPASREELCAIIEDAHSHNQALRISGGATLKGIGGDVVAHRDLSLCTFTGIEEFEPGDLTIGARAGTTLTELSETLGAYRLTTPLDAPQPRIATLGGTLASGWLGPRRHRLGRSRDAVIGTEIVLANGRLAKSGGMVVKNVTGYDLSKLYIGSFGTLGVLARANLKLTPLPQCGRGLLARLPELSRGRAIERMRGLASQATAALIIDGFHREIDGEDGTDGRIFVLIESSQTTLELHTRDTRSALGQAGIPEAHIIDHLPVHQLQRIIDAVITNVGERSVTYRVLGDPLEHRLARDQIPTTLQHLDLKTEAILDVFNGDLFLRISDRDARAFASKLAELDDRIHDLLPRAIVIACAHPLREQLNLWGKHPLAFEKMLQLKSAFDPKNILNPGRFLGNSQRV